MVGILDDSYIRFPVGSRIRIGSNAGTVKYVGEVTGHPGTWLGIEWDDPQRGKHDGSFEGKRYFYTQHATNGSFIRSGKVEAFESLEEAARHRYLDYTSNSLDQTLLRETQASMQSALFEVVGMEKIARKQSKFEQLCDVSVCGCNVNSAGFLTDFNVLTALNLSRTLIWNWEIVADIAKQIPTLKDLNLSHNRIVMPNDAQVDALEPSFRHVKYINLGNCAIDWKYILQTARLWPNIKSLGLQENPISELSEVNCKQIFRQLKNLDFHRTKIRDFDQICKLGNIKTLVSLNLMENEIEEIKLPECEPEATLDMFVSLEQLNVLYNPIWNESDAFNELDKLPRLKRLCKTPHLKSDFDEMFSKAVAMISQLDNLNKRQITAEERRGAEYDIWKRYGLEWLQASKTPESLRDFYTKHRTYSTFVKKYGSPAEFVPRTITKQSNLIKIRIQNERTGEIWEKKIPRMVTVQTLQGLIAKHFNLEQFILPQLSYVDAKHPDLVVPLDNASKSLDYYSMHDNDTVILQI